LRLCLRTVAGGKRRANAALRAGRGLSGSFTKDLRAEAGESEPSDARPTVAFLLSAAFWPRAETAGRFSKMFARRFSARPLDCVNFYGKTLPQTRKGSEGLTVGCVR